MADLQPAAIHLHARHLRHLIHRARPPRRQGQRLVSSGIRIAQRHTLLADVQRGTPHSPALTNNNHAMVTMSSLRAGYRLVLHGPAPETQHAILVQFKREQAVRLKPDPQSGAVVLADEAVEATA